MESIIDVLGKNLPWVWVAVTVICIVIETLTLSLTTIWFAISAFLMVFIALTPMPFVAQLTIFVVLALVLLIFTRPFVKKKINQKKIATNYERIIGQIAIVTKDISALEKGTIKINGMEWTAAVAGTGTGVGPGTGAETGPGTVAVSENENITLEKGSQCIIEKIEGVTAYVKKLD